jgi:hypothetical protein
MSLAIDETIPRHIPENAYNYSNLQLAQRKKALLDMKKDYPHIPEAWLEMAYDFHENTPKEEIEEIINSDKWSKPGQFSNNQGGTLVCGEVLDPSDPSGN